MPRPCANEAAADLLLIADRRDPVATLIAAEARRHDRRLVVMEHEDAGRMFTIVGEADATRVEPDLPMLLRPTSPPIPNRDAGARFLSGESHAALWAAAALARSPVLNRPTLQGFEAGWCYSAAITERRARAAMAPELYARDEADAGPPDDRSWAVEDVRGRARRWVRPDTGDAPYRARPVIEDEAYERVVVVNRQAWRSTLAALDGFDLEGRSIAIAGELGLGFAVVTWGLDPRLAQARLARIDPYPRVDQLLPVWQEAAPALIEALAC
ncbi:hypothetical protein FRZ61_06520 [Hypericibacter adhaerens]|uniref:ATP-grasp domain-containing protein n=1 Tax=Hypericibacter adhaerens TaxID=2602016 RepID=A0A5J6MU31_9PROT|nr:hypothetical protein [Hypericibacter adhaerens]QEX20733.1 hypothetical protein FRZ61_06520 [Hypericibacter adhaerens]